MRTTQLILTACLFSSTTLAGVSDFYVAGADSRIYSVDGQTLQATEIFQIDSSGQAGINDILFTGGDTMLANITGQLVQYDMVTGAQNTVLNLRDHYDSGFQYAGGLARTLDDRIAFSVHEALNPSGTRNTFGMYDPFSGSYETVINPLGGSGLYFDVHQLSEDVMLGMSTASGSPRLGSILVINTTDGTLVEEYTFDFEPVSFLELDGQLFILDKRSGLHTFDPTTGQSALYGSIDGVDYTIGATSNVAFRIPAPGVPMVLAMGGLVAARRRRA